MIAAPEIKKFDIEANHDFIILGCDGIFDKMSNEDCVKTVWTSLQQNPKSDIHQALGIGTQSILDNTLHRKSLDNVTAVIIALDGYH